MSSFEHCLNYTALGNSIPFGVGASFNVNDFEQHGYGYVYYFRDFLASIYSCVDLKNLAARGITSEGLLKQLQTPDPVTRAAVKNADLITISIGGNDLLDCLGATKVLQCAETVVANFAQNWALIMKEIRENIHSYAEIYVMTLYNPFRGTDKINGIDFSTIEAVIQQINNVMIAGSCIYHYRVVDVHADFLGKFMGTDTWKVCIWTHFCAPLTPPSLPNPHPTDSGHLEIARLHELAYLRHHPHKLHHLDYEAGLCKEGSAHPHPDPHHHHLHPHHPHPHLPHPLRDESSS